MPCTHNTRSAPMSCSLEATFCSEPKALSRRCATTCTSFGVEPPAACLDWRTARTCDQGHGRLEIRELEASTELNAFLADKWTGGAQVFRLVRTVTKKGKTSEEVIYG